MSKPKKFIYTCSKGGCSNRHVDLGEISSHGKDGIIPMKVYEMKKLFCGECGNYMVVEVEHEGEGRDSEKRSAEVGDVSDL